MNAKPLSVALALAALALALGAPGAALAQEQQERKHEHEIKLPEVTDLMRKVEQRLAEAETGQWTQSEQERIVRALEGQDAAVAKLKAIIAELEKCSE